MEISFLKQVVVVGEVTSTGPGINQLTTWLIVKSSETWKSELENKDEGRYASSVRPILDSEVGEAVNQTVLPPPTTT